MDAPQVLRARRKCGSLQATVLQEAQGAGVARIRPELEGRSVWLSGARCQDQCRRGTWSCALSLVGLLSLGPARSRRVYLTMACAGGQTGRTGLRSKGSVRPQRSAFRPGIAPGVRHAMRLWWPESLDTYITFRYTRSNSDKQDSFVAAASAGQDRMGALAE